MKTLAAFNRPRVNVCESRAAMGAAAAAQVHHEVSRRVAEAGHCRIIMSCAPSQDEFQAALVEKARAQPAPWRSVEMFHMDDYVGLTASHPQSFRHYLARHFLDHVEVAAFHPLCAEAADIEREAARYGALLRQSPIDIICFGIGENGHLAFIDPPVADFDDPQLVKLVELDEVCRQQQVNDGCFPTIGDVPQRALTITLPVFAAARMLSGVVSTRRKAPAVRDALLGPIGPQCPASLLRTHARASLFLDHEAAALLPTEAEDGSSAEH